MHASQAPAEAIDELSLLSWLDMRSCLGELRRLVSSCPQGVFMAMAKRCSPGSLCTSLLSLVPTSHR
jgi:hypothetical protein